MCESVFVSVCVCVCESVCVSVSVCLCVVYIQTCVTVNKTMGLKHTVYSGLKVSNTGLQHPQSPSAGLQLPQPVWTTILFIWTTETHNDSL